MKILLTGASGFIGGFVRIRLENAGHKVVAVSRSPHGRMVRGPELSADADWRPLLGGVDAVVHAAAAAHATNRELARSEYHRTNCEGTLRLAEQAGKCGVKRFVFLSSIGVFGDHTTIGRPFSSRSPSAPMTDYARSKWLAEQGLERLGQRIGLPWVVIRPPLVYGLRAPGNVGRLLRAIELGIPIPLGGVRLNRRSFVSRANLTDLIEICLNDARSVGGRYLVSDYRALSTAEFVAALGRGAGRGAQLVSVPSGMVSLLIWSMGGAHMRRQLLGDLEIDTSETKTRLGWCPRLDIESALQDELCSYAIP